MSGGHFAYMRRLDDPLDVDGLELWIGGGMHIGAASGTLFQTMSTELGATEILGMARARYPLIEHVTASARVGLGSARTSLELKDQAGHSLSDSAWGGLAEAALGLELTGLESHAASIGLRLELGYVRATAPALSPRPDTPDDGTLRLTMSQASIGHLDLSGPFVEMSLLSQF
jgi:hypothetical protein